MGGVVAKLCTILTTPWTVAHQAPLSMGFSRPEYWSGLPFPSPGDLPNWGIEPRPPALQADFLPSELQGKPLQKSCSIMSSSLWPNGLYSSGIPQARILAWVTFPFSRGSSQPRDGTKVPHIAGRFFTSWATKEVLPYVSILIWKWLHDKITLMPDMKISLL